MLAQRRFFEVTAFELGAKPSPIPVEIEYEVYGSPENSQNGTILVCHPLTTTPHAAGKYDPSEQTSGWWSALIGPGKAIDTDKYFVICPASISNPNVGDVQPRASTAVPAGFHSTPRVVSTGPASIDMTTGTRYGLNFPIFTLSDVVRLHKQLCDELGIGVLKAVVGPSMGGWQAFLWAKMYPEMVERCISVGLVPISSPYFRVFPSQFVAEAIMSDPDWREGCYYDGPPPIRGLMQAFRILVVHSGSPRWINTRYGHKYLVPQENTAVDPGTLLHGGFPVTTNLDLLVAERARGIDANALLYILRATDLCDLREDGESYESALGRIKSHLLLIADKSDPTLESEYVELTSKSMPRAEFFGYDSGDGHFSTLFGCDHFAESVKEFLERKLEPAYE